MTTPKTIVIATHRRSGTHWTIDALRNNSSDINNKFLTLEQTEPSHHQPIPLDNFQTELESLSGRVLLKVHDLPSALYWKTMHEREFALAMIQGSPTIYVHRDGRDVMVSLYHYMKSFREDFADLSFSDFLRMDNELDGKPTMSRPAYWAHHVETWLKHPKTISVAYESLENDYETTVQRLADFLKIQLNNDLQTVDIHQPNQNQPLANRILNKIGLKRRKVSTAVSPRKGKSGDWRNHFSNDDLVYFMSEVGDVMWQLGYVRDERLDNEELERHKDMWENPEGWALAPTPRWVDKAKFYGNVKVAPVKKTPLGYTEYGIPSNVAELIVNKMIEAGVEILDEIPNETLDQRYQHMWTDRKDEFVLFNSAIHGGYVVYYKPTMEMVHIYRDKRDWCIENMHLAGVEVLEKKP